MIDIHRGTPYDKTSLAADEPLAPASFMITAGIVEGAWDVRLRRGDRDLMIPSQGSLPRPLTAGTPWLLLSLPQALSDGEDQGTTMPLNHGAGSLRETIPDLDLLVIAKPWHQPFDSRQRIKSGRRTICLSITGEYGGEWYDGPMIHVRPDGDVASLIPSGGHATLRIPLDLVPGSRGIAWDEALALDAMDEEKVHRCLLARVEAFLGQQGDESWTFDLAAPSSRAASLLVLLREARPEAAITVDVPPESLGAQRGPWRRLGQNIGVDIPDGRSGKKSSPPTLNRPLPIHLIDEMWVAPLIRSLTRISDVIPRSLIP